MGMGLRGGAAKKTKKAAKAKPKVKKTKKKAVKKGAGKKKKKAKRVSKIAKGKQRKVMVFKGKKEKTVGGLKKADLIKNKYGRIVSKKQSLGAKKKTGAWTDAVVKARRTPQTWMILRLMRLLTSWSNGPS